MLSPFVRYWEPNRHSNNIQYDEQMLLLLCFFKNDCYDFPRGYECERLCKDANQEKCIKAHFPLLLPSDTWDLFFLAIHPSHTHIHTVHTHSTHTSHHLPPAILQRWRGTSGGVCERDPPSGRSVNGRRWDSASGRQSGIRPGTKCSAGSHPTRQHRKEFEEKN